MSDSQAVQSLITIVMHALAINLQRFLKITVIYLFTPLEKVRNMSVFILSIRSYTTKLYNYVITYCSFSNGVNLCLPRKLLNLWGNHEGGERLFQPPRKKSLTILHK